MSSAPGPSGRLIAIPFSHYCEKARWGLDLANISYREDGYLPFFHVAPVARATRDVTDKEADGYSTANSTPVFVPDGGEPICGSTEVLAFIDATTETSLFPNDESRELDAYFSTALGPHTRRLAYFHLLDQPKHFHALIRENATRKQAIAYRVMSPAVRALLRKLLRVYPQKVAASTARIFDVFDRVDTLLSDGRPMLAGATFSAADISFAALVAPALVPQRSEGYPTFLPSHDDLGPDFRDLVQGLRARPAGQHALRLYSDHRPVRRYPAR